MKTAIPIRPANAPAAQPAHLAATQAALAAHADTPGALLPVLHAVQDALGFVPATVVPVIAQALNRSRAEVHGVVTYYHHFRSEPAGRHVLQVCSAEACKACGADELMQHAQLQLGCDSHQTSADGGVTLLPVYCLGLCASSPAVQIDDRLHARVTPQRLQSLIAQLERAP